MIPETLSPLANHLWQSTGCGAIVWLLTVALRRNRAAVRHGLWLAASIKFLVPFSGLVDVVGRFGWRLPVQAAPTQLPVAVTQLSWPFEPIPWDAPLRASASLLPELLFAVWLCGVVLSAAVWFRLWRRFREAVRIGTPLNLDLPIPILISPARQEPAVFGICKPVLLVPDAIMGRLTGDQLRAILAHELCHVRRRDNLTGAVHMLVETIFWFHPLVWWIGARLAEERERACDEEVVRMGNQPGVYAEGILNVCRLSVRSALPCASGVSGSDLRKRIETIVSGGISANLTFARKLLLAAAGVVTVVGPVVVGLIDAPRIKAQSTGLKFDVASIKPNKPDAGGSGPRALGIHPAPGGSLRAHGVNLRRLILAAHGIQDFQLSSGPGWTTSELYDIEAKPEKPDAPADQQTTNARFRERLQALLADRFQLALRKEARESSGYVLTIAKGGLKIPESKPDTPKGGVSRGLGVLTSKGAPFEYLVFMLSSVLLGRPVEDQTGLAGKRFDFELKYAEEEALVAQANAAAQAAGKPADLAPDPSAPSLTTALQQELGLKLEAIKAPAAYYVIERAVKPTAN